MQDKGTTHRVEVSLTLDARSRSSDKVNVSFHRGCV